MSVHDNLTTLEKVAITNLIKRRGTLETHCMVGNIVVLKGEALVLAPSRKFD